jgi:two-component system sensor histidine kinase PilS (NtrC family)
VLQLPADYLASLTDLTRTRSRRIDYEFRRADGRSIDLGLSAAPLPLPHGGQGFVFTFQDVTDIKRFERNARLQQRLAAVGEMAAGIAHEIRNPLASMSGSMQMLRQELPLSTDQAQLLDIVLKESDRLNDTIKSFLAYARPQRPQPRRLDLRLLVEETAVLLRNSPEVGERHRLDVQSPSTPVPFDGDEGQVRQIIWNLATNGLRAMPAGGRLGLVTCLDTLPDGGSSAVLEVQDGGTGIPAEEIEHIFQPFRGSFGKGTGLGLAIVHRIVTDSNGRIDVSSTPGEGTTFRVAFPGVRSLAARAS